MLEETLKVVQVVNDFFPDTGGAQRVVLELSKALKRRGVRVKIVCATRAVNGEHGTVEDLPVVYAGHVFRVSQALISLKLVNRLISEDADLVHTHLPYPWSADWAAIVGRLRNKPVVLTYHNDIVGSGWKGLAAGAYTSSLLQMTLALVDRIVVTTPHRLRLSPALRRFAHKVVPVPLGVDAQRFRPLALPTDGGTIGFLALLRDTHRYKGLDVLLEAARLLRDRGISFRLKIGGAGNLLPHYQRRRRELGLGQQAEFLGFLPEDQLAMFYNSVDVFVLPSIDRRFEGFGLVALEALACGRPVVTTSAAGIASTVAENGCGLVVPAGDAAALADAIVQLLGDAELRAGMGQQGRAVAERHSWTQVAAAHQRLYEEVVSHRKGGGGA